MACEQKLPALPCRDWSDNTLASSAFSRNLSDRLKLVALADLTESVCIEATQTGD